ncbi:MAG: Tol-Pal system beta propeller repeat protein TolB [Paracoccus sp. (in: a-proteobacteria)]|nr:Tol-Pal system beta propeller repeat protein TolB [Paracoccus sp. (in: a-proteobacteria)]
MIGRRGFLAGISAGALLPAVAPGPARAQSGPLRIEIFDGVDSAIPIVFAPFETRAGAEQAAALAAQIASVAADDLISSGRFALYEAAPADLPGSSFDGPVAYSEWRMTEAELLITGAVAVAAEQVTLQFRLFDIFAGQPLGDGMQLQAPLSGWRRLAHKLADQALARITGEQPYFDSRIAFVGRSGDQTSPQRRIGVMDYDGHNVKWLSDGEHLVLAPRISPDGQSVMFTTYASGVPQLVVVDVETMTRRQLTTNALAMSFAARMSADGEWIAFSRETDGNTDIWVMDRGGVFARKLTSGPSIDTAPSWSPDGQQIVFESDRSGSPQLYVMAADGSNPRRISFQEGRYGAPVWSPRGDLIAFTRVGEDGARIGVMRPDGSSERMLSTGPGDESPSWAPGGRMIVFGRQVGREPETLNFVDLAGRTVQPGGEGILGAEPYWGPLLP